MTNIELIERLQESVDKYGNLPVDIEYSDDDSVRLPFDLIGCRYDKDKVTIFNY